MIQVYVLGLVCASMACGILAHIIEADNANKVVRFLFGIFLTLMVCSPMKEISVDFKKWDPKIFLEEAEIISATGTKSAKEAKRQIIKEACEAYVLEKSALMLAELEVEVSLGENEMPERIKLSGDASPYARRNIEYFLEKDLGITKENQLWTG